MFLTIYLQADTVHLRVWFTASATNFNATQQTDAIARSSLNKHW